MSRKWILFFLRCCVSLGLLYAVATSVDYRMLAGLLPNVTIRLVFLSLILVFLDRTLMAVRWHVLLKAVHVAIPLLQVVRVYWVAGFLGLFLPSSVAPDVMRAYLAARYHCSGGVALASVFWDRFVAFASLSLLACCSWLTLFVRGESWVDSLPMMAVVLGSLVISGCVVVGLRFFNQFIRRTAFVRNFRSFSSILKDFGEYSTFYTKLNIGLIWILCISFVNHAVYVFTIYFLIRSLHLNVWIVNLCVLVPLVTFIAILPISINGIGVQESAYVYLLSKSGLSVPEAFAVAVLLRIVVTLGSLPGGIIYLWFGTESRELSRG